MARWTDERTDRQMDRGGRRYFCAHISNEDANERGYASIYGKLEIPFEFFFEYNAFFPWIVSSYVFFLNSTNKNGTEKKQAPGKNYIG